MMYQYATSSSPSDNPHLPTHETCIENIVVGLFTLVDHKGKKRRLNHTSRCGVRDVKVLPGFRPRETHTSTHSGPSHSSFTSTCRQQCIWIVSIRRITWLPWRSTDAIRWPSDIFRWMHY